MGKSQRPGAANANANADDGAPRRASTVSNASNGPSGSRYSWHGDTERTRVLLRLVTDVVAAKPEDQRRVTTTEWEVLLDAFNREVSPPAEGVRVLHNRFTNLRTQCKEYHLIVAAQRSGHLDSVDAWVGFLHAHPTLRKWRKKPFEFYDEMAECLRLHGEDLDHPPTDGDGEGEAETAIPKPMPKLKSSSKGTPKRRRVHDASSPPPPPKKKPTASEPVLSGVASVSHYPAALRHLAALGLTLEERVDAKRFLVDDASAKAFIYMDDAERRFYLQKYCFDKRRETGNANAKSTNNTNNANNTNNTNNIGISNITNANNNSFHDNAVADGSVSTSASASPSED